jgi:hypothetical protein
MRSTFRVVFALVIALSLAFGIFAGAGTQTAQAASGTTVGPQGSTAPGIGYCYPTGYNRQGWRCGWRLAQAPYNLGNYNYYYNGYYNPYGYNNYYNSGYYGNSGYGGYPPSNVTDYGGYPRYGYYYYNGYYNPCMYYNNPYCYGYPK